MAEQPNGGPRRLTAEQKSKLKLLFLAKHALAGGQFDNSGDGNHSIYHHEILTILKGLGLAQVTAANNFEALFQAPDANYVFTLLNRAGFFNSEVLASALCERLKIPYMGSTPVARGLTDDKHYSKHLFKANDIPTPRWCMIYRADKKVPRPAFGDGPIVIKPNNSSASWGIGFADDWEKGQEHINKIINLGWDVIVEEYIPGEDVAVPVIGTDPLWVLPAVCQVSDDPHHIITYEQKRGFASGLGFERFQHPEKEAVMAKYSRIISRAVGPFDYGRIDYRLDERDGTVYCLEINLSCNLASTKAIAKAAEMVGVDHAYLVETILAASLERQRQSF